MQMKAANIKFEDFSLVQQWRRGDSAAMEQLIVRYQDRIYNAILRISANPDDAAELTQDTFVKALENIDSFRGHSSFYTWLFRIAVNLTLNYCARRAKFGPASLDEEKDSPDRQAASRLRMFLADEGSPDPAVLAEKKEIYTLMYKALARLDDAHRAVIVLRDIEGMNYAEIAEALNIELGTVKSRLSRARGNLREIIQTVLK